VDTSCKECCFAEYADKTQIGCYLGKLHKFRQAGIEILDAYDATKEFYVIKNKKCIWHRPPMWGKIYTKRLVEQVELETKFKCDLVIYLDKHNTLNNLIQTVASANFSTILPSKIIIINNNANIKPSQINKVGQDYFTNKWTLEIIIQENLCRNDCVSLVTNRLTGQYFIVLGAGEVLNENLIKNIDLFINDKMKMLLLSEDSEKYGLIVQKILFKLCNNHIEIMEQECKNQSQVTPIQSIMT
jgi:hypothetical protein